MNIRFKIALIFACLSVCTAYAQHASLLSDKKMDVNFDLLYKINNLRTRDDAFRFISGSLNVIPLVAIFPDGEDDWKSEVHDYDHELRVLLYNSQGEVREWSIKNPREDPDIEWVERNGLMSGRNMIFETYIESKLQSMISFVGAGKQLYFVYFFPSEIYTNLPVIGYVEDGKDVFVDSRLQTYNLVSLLNSRYGSVERYRELYDNYKKLMSYDPGRIPEGSYTRLISHTNVVKEIATCVEKYKFKNIYGKNVKDTIFKRFGKNTLVVTSYDGKHILYSDMVRRETKLGDLEAMDECYFYARDYGNIYDKGNCNE